VKLPYAMVSGGSFRNRGRLAASWDGTLKVCGNRLGNCDNALLWNHETGEWFDLVVGPCELLKTASANGIDWIDFDADGSLAIARRQGTVSSDLHLHWTTPLILGGQVAIDNGSLVQCDPHLGGHAELWSQISGLPPGTRVITR